MCIRDREQIDGFEGQRVGQGDGEAGAIGLQRQHLVFLDEFRLDQGEGLRADIHVIQVHEGDVEFSRKGLGHLDFGHQPHLDEHFPDPFAAPDIRAGYLTHPEDIEHMLCGVRLARRILAARAFDAYRGVEIVPGRDVLSDDDLRHFIRTRAETIYHPVGTCMMGRDPLAVVDAEMRVHGLSGLRVVDASIMPLLVGGNTNAPTVMIAEKASDMIRASRRG